MINTTSFIPLFVDGDLGHFQPLGVMDKTAKDILARALWLMLAYA